MNHFVCIDFINHPILLPKEGLIRIKPLPVYLKEQSIEGEKGYYLYITKDKTKLSRRFWGKIEDHLISKGVSYYVSKEEEENPFSKIQLLTGERIPFLLSKSILEYIFKYNLLQKDEKYVKIGIVAGNKKETLDTIAPMIHHITDLTLFTTNPSEYKELKEEIYQVARFKPKVFIPNQTLLSQMDIVFDTQKRESYVNRCSPKAIYVDLYKNIVRRKIKVNQPAPIVWYDFEIAFENTLLTKELLEAVLYQRGCSPRSIRSKIARQQIRISRAYTRR